MPSEPSDIMLIVKGEKLPELLKLVKENNIRDLQLLFDGALQLMEKYLRVIKEGKRFLEVDEKSGQALEIILDWGGSARKPMLTILKGGKQC